MNISMRIAATSVLLMSQFFGLFVGSTSAQSPDGTPTEAETQQQLEHVKKVEHVVDKIYDIVEEKIPAGDMKDRLDEKKDEIEDMLEDAQEEIKDGVSKEEAKEVLQEVKKKVYLKTYSGLTDHDSVEELVQVEGGRKEQKQAIETALDAMKSEESETYTIMLQSRKSLEEVKKSLSRFDDEVLMEELFVEDGIGYFELTVEEGSLLGEELLGEVEDGEIPDHLLGISVIKPEVYEIGDINVAGYDGEKNTNLRGMEQYKSVLYQGGLQQKKKITVGVVDTGIDATHPDLIQNISKNIAGYDFVNKDSDPMDDHVHGTHVAGTIGGMLNGKGVYGVNTNVELVALKICNKYGYCPSYAIYNAVKYAANKGIDVLNMSLGGRGSTRNNTTCQAIDYAIKKGVIVAVAAGNANKPVQYYIPGACSGAITVGAVDENHKRAGFSNYGPLVDVSAPGVGIYSTIPGGKYQSLDGTSMATPHVAGLISAILAYKPNLSQEQVRNLLKKHGKKVSYESGKVIGNFVQMPSVMNSMGVKQLSHSYTPVTSVAGSEDGITIQAFTDEGMKVHTQHIRLQVGQKKQLVVTEATGKITANAAKSRNDIFTLGIGASKKPLQTVRIASNGEDNGPETSEIEVLEENEESNDEEDIVPEMTDEEIQKALALPDEFEAGSEVEELVIDASDEEDGAMIASAGRVGLVDVMGLKPGVSYLTVTDQDFKTIQVKVEVLPRTITVKQGSSMYLSLPSWIIPSSRGPYYSAQKNSEYYVTGTRNLKAYKVTGYDLGSHTMTVPLYNFHAPLRNGKRKVGSHYLLMEFTIKVISPRVDAQSKKQAADDSFRMSHDYAKLNVGEKITIKLEGEGPFKMKRKDGTIVGYAGKSGDITKIANAGDEEQEEEMFDLDFKQDAYVTEDDIQGLLPAMEEMSAEDLISEDAYEGDADVVLEPVGEEMMEGAEKGGVEIASAGGTTFTLVGLKPGNEVVYVTDKRGNTKNVIVQVQETIINVSECKRNYRGYYARGCGQVKISPDPSWNTIYRVGYTDRRSASGFYARLLPIRGYEIPDYRKKGIHPYGRHQAAMIQANSRTPKKATKINVYVENLIEDPKKGRNRRVGSYSKKITQVMEYTINYGSTAKPAAITLLSKLPLELTEVPDAFRVGGTVRMTVGDMKTVMVGSQGGTYRYAKANNRIGFITNKTQDVKIASASEESDALLPPTGEEIEENKDDDFVVPDDITDIGDLTAEQLSDIDAIQSEESDLSYEESEDESEEGVGIASVKGKPLTFVALRPGVSYLAVYYTNGKKERMKVIVSPKKISKKSTDTLRLSSTHNLVIKNIWTSKRSRLQFVKKPKKRWKGGIREIKASSMQREEKLYAQVYNRKERRTMYLELHPSVIFPPIKTSKNSLILTAGQSTTLGITGGGGWYSVSKNTHRLGLINARNQAVGIASAAGSDDETPVEVIYETDEAELDDIDVDETLEDLPSDDQLVEPEEKEDTQEESDFSSEEAPESQDGVDIASSWKKYIHLQALRPTNSGKIVIKDNKGLTKTIPIKVNKKVIQKEEGELLTLTSAYGLPIRYAKTKSGVKLNVVKRPSKRWRGGTWKLDISNIIKQDTIYLRVLNRKERRYQWLEVDLKIKEFPPITTNRDRLYLKVGQVYNLKMAGGAHQIKAKDPKGIVGLVKKSWGVGIASAGETEEVAVDDTLVTEDAESDEYISDDEAPPTQEELDTEPDPELESSDEQNRGEAIETIDEPLTSDEGVEIASAKKRRMTIPVQGMKPGVSTLHITDEKGHIKKVKVRVIATSKTKKRGEALTLNSPYHMPIMYVVTKNKQKVTYISKPKRRRSGGKRLLDTSHLESDTLKVRVYNRKERRYMWMTVNLKVNDIPLAMETEHDVAFAGSTTALKITGGLPPYAFSYDKKKMQLLMVDTGETEHTGTHYIYGLSAGTTDIVVTDSRGQRKTLPFEIRKTDKQIRAGEELWFSQRYGFKLDGISASDGTQLSITKRNTEWVVDTSNITNNVILKVSRYSDFDKKSLTSEYHVIVRDTPTGPIVSGYTECQTSDNRCKLDVPATVAYGTDGRYKYKDFEANERFSCNTSTFGDPYTGKEKSCRWKERVVEEVVESSTPVGNKKIITSDSIETIHISGLGFSVVSLETESVPKEVGIEYKNGDIQKIPVDDISYVDVVESNKGAFRGYYIGQDNITYVGEYDEYSDIGTASTGVEIASASGAYRCEYNGKYYVRPYNGTCIEDGSGARSCNNTYIDLDVSKYGNTNSCVKSSILDHKEFKILISRVVKDKVLQLLKKSGKTLEYMQGIRIKLNSTYSGNSVEIVNILLDHGMHEYFNQDYGNGTQKTEGDTKAPVIQNLEYTENVEYGFMGGVYFEVEELVKNVGIDIKVGSNGEQNYFSIQGEGGVYSALIRPSHISACNNGCTINFRSNIEGNVGTWNTISYRSPAVCGASIASADGIEIAQFSNYTSDQWESFEKWIVTGFDNYIDYKKEEGTQYSQYNKCVAEYEVQYFACKINNICTETTEGVGVDCSMLLSHYYGKQSQANICKSKYPLGASYTMNLVMGVTGGFGAKGRKIVTNLNSAKGVKASGFASVADKLKNVKFSQKASQRMEDHTRYVPLEYLKEAILKGRKSVDPQGSTAKMYYHKMTRNGKDYTLEVLYDESSNEIRHFLYYN